MHKRISNRKASWGLSIWKTKSILLGIILLLKLNLCVNKIRVSLKLLKSRRWMRQKSVTRASERLHCLLLRISHKEVCKHHLKGPNRQWVLTSRNRCKSLKTLTDHHTGLHSILLRQKNWKLSLTPQLKCFLKCEEKKNSHQLQPSDQKNHIWTWQRVGS